jgi:uncharacterized protein YcbK (DUF882 family)
MMAGWLASSSPASAASAGEAPAANVATAPVQVLLYDENAREEATVWISRDGTADESNTAEIRRLFRCRRTHKEKELARGTLAMLADISTRYPGKRIEFVSGYRATSDESRTSPHRAARAIDFRIRGVSPIEIRDYLWSTYREVGIGWYPKEQYIHMDHRPGDKDISWTFLRGTNVYNPSWADRARSKAQPSRTPGTPGV